MGLSIENSLGKIQKYKKNITYYLFNCSECHKTMEVRTDRVTKSCGLCLKCSGRRSGKMVGLRPYEALFNVFRKKALSMGYEVGITYEDFLVFTEQKQCFYCDEPVKWSEKNTSFGSSYNLDRIDNNFDYVKGNLVVCCKRCNFLKSDKFSFHQYIEIAKVVKTFKPVEPWFTIETDWKPEVPLDKTSRQDYNSFHE